MSLVRAELGRRLESGLEARRAAGDGGFAEMERLMQGDRQQSLADRGERFFEARRRTVDRFVERCFVDMRLDAARLPTSAMLNTLGRAA